MIKQFTIPVYLQDSLNLDSYLPKTSVTFSKIPDNHYVGEFSCYYEDVWRGERDVVVVVTGDGGSGGKFADSKFGRDVIEKGFIVIEPLEPNDSVIGVYNKPAPFSVNSSITDIDPRQLMRSRGGHIHKAIITGLMELDRRNKLDSGEDDYVAVKASGKYTFLCQSRGSRSSFYLANCQLNYPPNLDEKYKYLNRVDYWFLAGFPFETTGISVPDNVTQSSMSFSNMISTTPRKSKIIICANDTDNLTGSDIRRVLMYCVCDKRREDVFIVNEEDNGHFIQGNTQLSFLDCIAKDTPLSLVFNNTPTIETPLINLLGQQGLRSSDVFPTKPFNL